VLLTIGGIFMLFYVTWALYLSVMHLVSRRDALTTPAKAFAYPLIVVALVIDVIFNVTFGSVLFVDAPREWLFTHRLNRYVFAPGKTTWRGRLAEWLCANLLDPFDPSGCHCKDYK
jgi:hypothetical protein